MKGFIFTDFLKMVSEVFSPQMVEDIIDDSKLPNEGAYTDIGTYDYKELLQLVTHLSARTNMSVPDLEVAYGKYLFTQLKRRYEKFVLSAANVFEFLKQVDSHIHVEVRKLYPEAELPKFDCEMINPTCMTLKYQSNHPFEKLAEGLMIGCAEIFNEKIKIDSKRLNPTPEKSNVVLFTLTRQS